MNSKWIIGIIVAIVIIVGGLFILNKNYSPSTPVASTPTRTETQPNTVPTSDSASTTPSTATSQQNVITLTKDKFLPATLAIKAGTTVTWENKSGSDVAVNSDPHPVHTNYSPLNLGTFSEGGKLSLTFDKPGIYGYHNHLNPSQTGKIVVQ